MDDELVSNPTAVKAFNEFVQKNQEKRMLDTIEEQLKVLSYAQREIKQAIDEYKPYSAAVSQERAKMRQKIIDTVLEQQ